MSCAHTRTRVTEIVIGPHLDIIVTDSDMGIECQSMDNAMRK